MASSAGKAKRSKVEQEIRRLVQRQTLCEVDELTRNADLEHDLGLDSLDLVEVVMELEEVFELGETDDGHWENVRTLGELIERAEELAAKF